MTPTPQEAREALEDAIDCCGAVREDDEIVAVQAGNIRLTLDYITASEARIQELVKENGELKKAWEAKHKSEVEAKKEARKWFDLYQTNKTQLAERDALLSEAGEVLEWQPIETAPKDQWVIVTDGDAVEPALWCSTKDDDGHIGWCVAGHEYGGVLYDQHNLLLFKPSRWMPLPAPPQAEGE